MFSKDVAVTVPVGLHARPAMYFSQKAGQFHSNIWIEHEGQRLNGKSILGILSLGISQGDTITIIAEGKDEETAVNKLVALVKSDFAEEN